MSGKTPQQRTMENLTARGYLCGSTERRKSFPDRKKHQCKVCGHVPLINISVDLWNVFDIVGVKPLDRLPVNTPTRLAVPIQPGEFQEEDGSRLPLPSSTNTRLINSPTKYFHAPEVIFVQTTSRNNHSTRRNKILASMEAKLVLLSGARILVQSWRQVAGSGTKWQAFDEWITLDMYDQAPHYPNTVGELMEIRRKEKKVVGQFPFPQGVR